MPPTIHATNVRQVASALDAYDGNPSYVLAQEQKASGAVSRRTCLDRPNYTTHSIQIQVNRLLPHWPHDTKRVGIIGRTVVAATDYH